MALLPFGYYGPGGSDPALAFGRPTGPLERNAANGRFTANSARFAVIGDYGYAGANEAAVAAMVRSWAPDILISVGDNNYNTGAASTIDQNIGQYFSDYIYPYSGTFTPSVTLTQNQFFPALGNHDWGNTFPDPNGADPYLAYFTLPGNERYYDFVWGPVHFYALDSDLNEPDGVTASSLQAAWLERQLASAAEKWRVVYLHHPPYSSGTIHGSTPSLQWPFRSWGATAVLAGHEHNYERIIQDGIPFFVNGLGGKSDNYPFSPTPVPGSAYRINNTYGAMLVTANDTLIQFEFYAITNSASPLDTFTVTIGSTSNRTYLPMVAR